MSFSRKDILKARENYWLKKGKELYGDKVESIDNLDFSKTPKSNLSLGEKLVKLNRRFHK